MRSSWQTLYLIQECNKIDSRGDFGPDTIGIGGYQAGPQTIYSMNPFVGGIFNIREKAQLEDRSIGVQTYQEEIIKTIQGLSTIQFSSPVNNYLLRLILTSLINNSSYTKIGEVSNGDTYDLTKCTITPTDSPSPKKYLSIVNPFNNNYIYQDRDSFEAWGGVVTNVRLSGNEGSLIKADFSIASSRFHRVNVLGNISNNPRIYYLKSNGNPPSSSKLYYEDSSGNWNLFSSNVVLVSTEDDFTNPDDLSSGTVEIASSTGAFNFSQADINSFSGNLCAIEYSLGGNRSKKYYDIPITFDPSPEYLKFQDLNLSINSNLVKVSSMTLNLTVNYTPKFYNREVPVKFVLGKLRGKLTIELNYEDQRLGYLKSIKPFKDLESYLIKIYFGNNPPSSDVDLEINMETVLTKVNYGINKNPYSVGLEFTLANTSSNMLEIILIYKSMQQLTLSSIDFWGSYVGG